MAVKNYSMPIKYVRWTGGEASRADVTALVAGAAQVLFDGATSVAFIVPIGNPEGHAIVAINQYVVTVPKFAVLDQQALKDTYPGIPL